jgi:hypothetical protein
MEMMQQQLICVSGGEAGGDSVVMEAARRAGAHICVYTFKHRLQPPQAKMTDEVVTVNVNGLDGAEKYSRRIEAMTRAEQRGYDYTALYAVANLVNGEIQTTHGGTGETINAFMRHNPGKPVYLLSHGGKGLHWMQSTEQGGWVHVNRPPAPRGAFVGVGSSRATKGAFFGHVSALFR